MCAGHRGVNRSFLCVCVCFVTTGCQYCTLQTHIYKVLMALDGQNNFLSFPPVTNESLRLRTSAITVSVSLTTGVTNAHTEFNRVTSRDGARNDTRRKCSKERNDEYIYTWNVSVFGCLFRNTRCKSDTVAAVTEMLCCYWKIINDAATVTTLKCFTALILYDNNECSFILSISRTFYPFIMTFNAGTR